MWNCPYCKCSNIAHDLFVCPMCFKERELFVYTPAVDTAIAVVESLTSKDFAPVEDAAIEPVVGSVE